MKLPEIKIENKVFTFKLTIGNMVRLKKEIGKNPLDAILGMYKNSDDLQNGDISALNIDEELMFTTLYYASQHTGSQKMTREKFDTLIQTFLDEEIVTETDEEIITEYRSILSDIVPLFLEISTQCGYIPRDKKVTKKEEKNA